MIIKTVAEQNRIKRVRAEMLVQAVKGLILPLYGEPAEVFKPTPIRIHNDLVNDDMLVSFIIWEYVEIVLDLTFNEVRNAEIMMNILLLNVMHAKPLVHARVVK